MQAHPAGGVAAKAHAGATVPQQARPARARLSQTA